MTDNCGFTGADQRRTFWTTQAAACGTKTSECVVSYGVPGLKLTPLCEPVRGPCGDAPNMESPCGSGDVCSTPRTIATDGWLESLVYNILGTDARLPDTRAGWRPGARGGHWTESLIAEGRPVGSRIRQIPTKTSIAALSSLLKSAFEDALGKLVTYKVATSVSVEVQYRGGRKFDIVITICRTSGTVARVGISTSATNETLNWAA